VTSSTSRDAEQPVTERILLVGMMGAGKTTTGRSVAARLGWDYLDSDAEVERVTGSTVPELFARHGEQAFRDAEADALRQACASTTPVVVSVAGGAVLRPENRELLRASGRVIWLRARPETLAARVGDGTGRPLLDDDPAAALVALDAVRRPLYAEVADETIDVDDLSPAEVVAQIVEGVEVGEARQGAEPAGH
jgi:shikimate kinase